jgi:hypothetical protein
MENKRQKNVFEDDEVEDNEMGETAAATVPVQAVRRKNLLLLESEFVTWLSAR